VDISTSRWSAVFVYLAVVLDWATRRVLSWRLSITIETAFCVETLEDALARHGKPEIFNTDQGSQFTSSAFTGLLASNGIAISMDGKGAWRDNVFVERLWRSVKYEEYTCRLTKPSAKRVIRSAGSSTFITAEDLIRVLTATLRIKPTSTRCHSAWQPNPGRNSTYRCGDSVQTSGTNSSYR
jgi:putative transposase